MKDEILNKATELFLSQGFKSVTMDDIAKEMGISKKTIYASYAHKTELVQEASSHILCSVQGGVKEIIKEHMNPIEELYEIKKYVIQHLKGEKSSSIQQLIKYYPKIFEQVRQRQYDFMRSCMEHNIKRGIEQGLFRDNLDVEFVSRMYQVGIVNIKDESIFPENKFPHNTLYETYLEYHLRGIVTPEGRKILNQLIHSNQD